MCISLFILNLLRVTWKILSLSMTESIKKKRCLEDVLQSGVHRFGSDLPECLTAHQLWSRNHRVLLTPERTGFSHYRGNQHSTEQLSPISQEQPGVQDDHNKQERRIVLIYATLLKTWLSTASSPRQTLDSLPRIACSWTVQHMDGAGAAWSGLGYADMLKWRQLPELASPYCHILDFLTVIQLKLYQINIFKAFI